MDFDNRAFIVGVNLNDLESTPSGQNIFAEVVLIDKSNDVLQPLLYQLKSDALKHQNDFLSLGKQAFITMEDNAFAMIGEVITINKNKKQIYLKNEITVSYKYLILASGLKQSMIASTHDDELSAGLHTLMRAIRVRNNIPTALNPQEIERLGLLKRKETNPHSIKPSSEIAYQYIQEILVPAILSKSDKSLEMVLAGTDKRLYEVQL